MTSYNPFGGEENNPFEDKVEEIHLDENIQIIKPFNLKKYVLVSSFVITSLFSIGLLGNFLSNDSSTVKASDVDKVESIPHEDNQTVPEVSTTITQVNESNSYEESNESINLETVKEIVDTDVDTQNELIDQNLITQKTVQVVAEECGLGINDKENGTAVGSGVLISSDGLIISNQHIIEDCVGDIYVATTNDVDTPTSIKYRAEVIQESIELDLILLKITSSIDNTPLDNAFEYFELSGTDELVLGDGLEIWGFPTARGDGTTYSLKINLTKGTVSGFESDYQIKRGWIVTDADVTYGNSGGAALDKLGRLVGIPTFGTTEGASWISYLRSVDVIEAWLSETNSSTLLTNFSFPRLTIREHSISNIPKYSREDWNSWIDGDLDCQNTRHENLQLESFVNVLFTKSDNCYVQSGKWFDPYNGEFFYFASDLDIDHFIPLYNAHLSGGWKWDVNKKTDFANSLLDPDILIAVKNSTNREKGASAPDEWKPQNIKYWCEYAFDWIRIKHEWGLTATLSEWNSLLEMIDTCPNNFTYEDAKNSEHKMSIEKVLKYEQ